MEKSKLAKRASLLHLNALSVAQGMRSGNFKSLYCGQGIEFSGVREYLRGDDVRAIDWNVTARLGKPYVKMFNEERELDVFLVLDESFSMNTGSGLQSRLETAVDCASLLAFAAQQNSSPVGAVVFDGDISFACKPKAGKDQVLLLLSKFEDMEREKVCGSALDNALTGAIKLLKKRSLVIILSDFRTSEWIRPFSQLCSKHDVIAVRITDPLDEKIPEVGTVLFKDSESGKESYLPTSSSTFARQWREYNRQNFVVWQKECLRHGGFPLAISTDSDPVAELTNFFSARKIK